MPGRDAREGRPGGMPGRDAREGCRLPEVHVDRQRGARHVPAQALVSRPDRSRRGRVHQVRLQRPPGAPLDHGLHPHVAHVHSQSPPLQADPERQQMPIRRHQRCRAIPRIRVALAETVAHRHEQPVGHQRHPHCGRQREAPPQHDAEGQLAYVHHVRLPGQRLDPQPPRVRHQAARARPVRHAPRHVHRYPPQVHAQRRPQHPRHPEPQRCRRLPGQHPRPTVRPGRLQ
jgi:hypothetical protein